jgi:transposase-like protein
MTVQNELSQGSVDWEAIETEYVSGAEYSELAQKYNVKEATIRQRAKRGDWSQTRHEVAKAVTEKVKETVIVTKAASLTELKEIDLTAAQSLRDKAALMMAEVSTPNELKALAGTLDIAQKISRLALGASTENSNVTTKELPASVDDFV